MEVKLASLPYRNATDNAEGLQTNFIYWLQHTLKFIIYHHD